MSAGNLANGSREEINLDDIDPDNIDELLDEIELHEKKEEERRASQILAENELKILAEKELKLQINSPVDEEEEDPLLDWIRSIWKVSSYCEVYSNSGQKWFKGTIKRIFADDEGEWLEVQYINQDNTIRCRQTPRDDITAIRPLTKALSIYKYVYNAAITNQTNKIKTQFGQLQSPINIITTPKHKHSAKIISDKEFHTNPLKFNYNEQVENCSILNNGHTVQVNIGSKCEVFINNKVYELKQFHFHTPSEHTIDGKQYEMEMHLVHMNKQNEIAVLGFVFTTQKKHIKKPILELTKSRAHLIVSDKDKSLIQDSSTPNLEVMNESDDDLGTDDEWEEVINENANNNLPKIKKKKNIEGNDFLEQFWDDLPLNKTDEDIKLNKSISFEYLFETSSTNFIKTVSTNEINIDMEIFEYKGSLTTPPYTEGVQWLVSKKTHFISNKQLTKLSKCWDNQNNARPVQEMHGRTVSFRSKTSITT